MSIFRAIEGRRSIRRFKSDPVPKSDIEKMVYAASMAPSGGNLQPWHFLAVTNPECRDSMVSIVHDEGVAFFSTMYEKVPPRFILPSLVFSTAPLVFAVLTARSLLEEDGCFCTFLKNNRIEDRYTDLYGGFVNVQSASAAVENLLLAAYDLGYGSCWIRVPYYARERLEKFLKVEPLWDLLALVPVGVPDQSPSPPPRKPVKEILTYID